MPDSDAFNPRYGHQVTLAQGLDKFDNAAATLLLTVRRCAAPVACLRRLCVRAWGKQASVVCVRARSCVRVGCSVQVYTLERWTGAFRVVGYAALPCFLDPRTKEQPVSKHVNDYVLNTVRRLRSRAGARVRLATRHAPTETQGCSRGGHLRGGLRLRA